MLRIPWSYQPLFYLVVITFRVISYILLSEYQLVPINLVSTMPHIYSFEKQMFRRTNLNFKIKIYFYLKEIATHLRLPFRNVVFTNKVLKAFFKFMKPIQSIQKDFRPHTHFQFTYLSKNSHGISIQFYWRYRIWTF